MPWWRGVGGWASAAPAASATATAPRRAASANDNGMDGILAARAAPGEPSATGVGAGPRAPRVPGDGYLCLKPGLRFSTNARMPSFWSSVAKSEWNMRRSKRIPSASGVS